MGFDRALNRDEANVKWKRGVSEGWQSLQGVNGFIFKMPILVSVILDSHGDWLNCFSWEGIKTTLPISSSVIRKQLAGLRH